MRTLTGPSTGRRRSARRAALPSMLALLVWATPGVAQNNLGQLLDAGGTLMKQDEFKQELVQRVLVGPTPSGGGIELMYTSAGTIQGVGSLPGTPGGRMFGSSPYNGVWTDGENGTVCATMNVTAAGGGVATTLPRRCQFWFRLGDRYYLSDSDSDRSVKVLVRTIKP